MDKIKSNFLYKYRAIGRTLSKTQRFCWRKRTLKNWKVSRKRLTWILCLLVLYWAKSSLWMNWKWVQHLEKNRISTKYLTLHLIHTNCNLLKVTKFVWGSWWNRCIIVSFIISELFAQRVKYNGTRKKHFTKFVNKKCNNMRRKWSMFIFVIQKQDQRFYWTNCVHILIGFFIVTYGIWRTFYSHFNLKLLKRNFWRFVQLVSIRSFDIHI